MQNKESNLVHMRRVKAPDYQGGGEGKAVQMGYYRPAFV
jgi:hypothetical protein